MEPNPAHVEGYIVVRIARIAPDTSERQNLAVVMVDTEKSVPGRFILWDIACNDGEKWDVQKGIYDLTEDRADVRFKHRVRQYSKLRKLANDHDTMWHDYALIRWDCLPVEGGDEFNLWALSAASKARNFAEFYAEENREVQRTIEEYLARWIDHHGHPSTRG